MPLTYQVGGRPIVLAHRGGADLNLENSPTAFAAAARQGITYVETDIRATSDGVAVLMHDSTLQRTTNGTGEVASLPWPAMAELRLKNGDPIPSLARMLQEFPDLAWNIDVKCDDAVLPLLGTLGAERAWDRVAIASFSGSRLRRLRQLAGGRLATATTPAEVARIRLGLTSGLKLGPGLVAAAQVPPQFWGVPLVTPQFVRNAHQIGMAVHVWTINDPQKMRELLDLGVDGLVTDRPDLAQQILG